MSEQPHTHAIHSLADVVRRETHVSVERCYQCGKCSAGCPLASEMDFPPSLLLRMIQTEQRPAEQTALSSYTIWLCVTCNTCVTRCPMEINLPAVMDVLRAESIRQHLVNRRANDIVAFHKSFLNTIRRFGRLWEIGLVAEYKTRTRHLWQDIVLAPVALKKGKLALLPHRVSVQHGKESE
jgi:heterodisulfide reductase subunit C